MKRFVVFLWFTLLLHGCSDGDIIVSNFNFENSDLQTCGDIGNYVFYKQNNQVFESLSLRLGTTDSIYKLEGGKTYDLSGSNSFVNYRTYDGPLPNNYFCSSIPPSSPKVNSDYIATSGTAQIIVTFLYDTPIPRAINQESIPTPTGHNKETSNYSPGFRQTVRKNVQVILKNIVLINGDQRIIQETIDMGTIENVRTEVINP